MKVFIEFPPADRDGVALILNRSGQEGAVRGGKRFMKGKQMSRKSIAGMLLIAGILMAGCSINTQKPEKQLTDEEKEIRAYRILSEHALDEPGMINLWNGEKENHFFGFENK